MRKLTTLLMAMLGALALTAASASAADLPYEDADPGHWATANAVECDGVIIDDPGENSSCAFSGTAGNMTIVAQAPGGPVIGGGSCPTSTLDFELEYLTFPERYFEVSRNGACGFGDTTREIHVCGYDSEGQFDDESTEYWVRDSVSGIAGFEPAFAKINEASRSGSVILADEVDYDDQRIYHDASLELIVDGTYELDEDVYLAPGAECMFPELDA